jgi:hypothetical protein
MRSVRESLETRLLKEVGFLSPPHRNCDETSSLTRITVTARASANLSVFVTVGTGCTTVSLTIFENGGFEGNVAEARITGTFGESCSSHEFSTSVQCSSTITHEYVFMH